MTPQQEKQEYIDSLKTFTDRELLELQTYFQRKQTDYLKSIDGRLFLFFLIMIIGFVIGIIVANS